MEWKTKPVPDPSETVAALNRIASAIERLTDELSTNNALLRDMLASEPEGDPTGPAMSGKGAIIRRV